MSVTKAKADTHIGAVEAKRGGARCKRGWDSTLTMTELALEATADALLRGADGDPEYPAYTEFQLARHGERYVMTGSDGIVEEIVSARPSESFLDELHFLASMTDLSRAERCALRGWMLGHSQQEIQRNWPGMLGRIGQQRVSELIRSAVWKCYQARDLSFARFSRHTVYRRPASRPERRRLLVCPACQEPFAYGLGAGRCCSTACREALHRRR